MEYPDYVNDTLTEKGRVEAALLAKAVPNMELGDCYMSPLGRAMDTAAYSLAATGKEAKVLDWLREFPAKVDINSSEFLQRAYPDTVKENGRFRGEIVLGYGSGKLGRNPRIQPFYTVERVRSGAAWGFLVSVYDKVAEEFDRLLLEYGYEREGNHYRVVKENEQHDHIILPFWSYLRSAFQTLERFAICALAYVGSCAYFGYRSNNRRKRKRNRLFPGGAAGRYFPSLCRRRRTFFCLPVL